MGREGTATLGIISRFAPSTQAISAVEAGRLADGLRRTVPGCRVRLYCAGGRYDGGRTAAVDLAAVEIVHLASGDSPKSGTARLFDALRLGLRFAWATRSCDVVIVQTDLPFLNLLVGLVSRVRRRPWVDWTLDLYPEAFVAAGLVAHDAWVVRGIAWLQRRVPPALTIALGEGQASYLRSTGRAAARVAILPCGVPSVVTPVDRSASAGRPLHVTYAGNVGAAHDVDRILAALHGFADGGAEVIVAPAGAKAGAVRGALTGRSNIGIRNVMSHADLALMDIHVASLSDPWTHVSVPSKVVTATVLGARVVFLGSPSSDVVRWAGSRCLVLPPSLSLSEIRTRCSQLARTWPTVDLKDTERPIVERYADGISQIAEEIGWLLPSPA